MKTLKYFVMTVVLFFGLAAQAGFFSRLVHFFSHIPILGNVVDGLANKEARKKVDVKINEFVNSARSCSVLESDPVSGITINEFINIKPGYPDWKILEKFETVANQASNEASELATYDKAKHCYAGCMIRQRLDYSAGVLAAFLKEVKDASDCDTNTHFEEGDYSATVAGAIAGGLTTCQKFCESFDTKDTTGNQILTAAQYIRQSQSSVLNRLKQFRFSYEEP